MNRIALAASLVERSALRYTPAGIPVLELQLRHLGEAIEAGQARTLDFEFAAVALGPVARRLDGEKLGQGLAIDGFLAPRSRRSSRLIVHINDYSSTEGA